MKKWLRDGPSITLAYDKIIYHKFVIFLQGADHEALN